MWAASRKAMPLARPVAGPGSAGPLVRLMCFAFAVPAISRSTVLRFRIGAPSMRLRRTRPALAVGQRAAGPESGGGRHLEVRDPAGPRVGRVAESPESRVAQNAESPESRVAINETES